MQKISYYSLLAKLIVGVAVAALAYVVLLTPTVTHAQSPSQFDPAEIVILNQNTPFHVEPAGTAVRFVVAGGTLAEVQYFAAPEVRNGQVWRKLRVADGFYGYVRESLMSTYTGTIPTIWREIDFQPSQVHLNYEARKVNYDIVINQGVNYVTPPEGVTGGTGTTDEDEDDTSTDDEDDTSTGDEDEDDTSTDDEEEDEDTSSEFEGGDIVVASKNAAFHEAPGGKQKFVVAKGTIAEILYFSTPQVVGGSTWHKLRVADGKWGYVRESSIDPFVGTVPAIWREINYQPSKVHLNYEARKRSGDAVITTEKVTYVSVGDDTIEDEDEDEDEDDTVVTPTTPKNNEALMAQLVALLKELLNLRMQLQQLLNQ